MKKILLIGLLSSKLFANAPFIGQEYIPTIEDGKAENSVLPEDFVVARTIMGESMGEDEFGQGLVADVIYERVIDKRWPATAHEVCTQATQFAGSKYEGPVTRFTLFLAMRIRWGLDPYPEYNFTHFWSGSFAPYWAEGKEVFNHGGHYFIRE